MVSLSSLNSQRLLPPGPSSQRSSGCPHQWRWAVQAPVQTRDDESLCGLDWNSLSAARRGPWKRTRGGATTTGRVGQAATELQQLATCPLCPALLCVSLVCVRPRRPSTSSPLYARSLAELGCICVSPGFALPCSPARPCACDRAASAASQPASTVFDLMVCDCALLSSSLACQRQNRAQT
jgi:hypothetical protein